MKEEIRIKRIDIAYTLFYIFVPIIVLAAAIMVSVTVNLHSNINIVVFLSPVVFGVIWYIMAGPVLFKMKKKKFFNDLEDMGFVQNYSFDGSGTQLAIDTVHKKIALLFRMNPFKSYVVPGSGISRAWVKDGRSGKGFMEGSSCVGFLFTYNGTSVQIPTFYSNQRWAMDSDKILKGIAKADMMVDLLNEVRREDE